MKIARALPEDASSDSSRVWSERNSEEVATGVTSEKRREVSVRRP